MTYNASGWRIDLHLITVIRSTVVDGEVLVNGNVTFGLYWCLYCLGLGLGLYFCLIFGLHSLGCFLWWFACLSRLFGGSRGRHDYAFGRSRVFNVPMARMESRHLNSSAGFVPLGWKLTGPPGQARRDMERDIVNFSSV